MHVCGRERGCVCVWREEGACVWREEGVCVCVEGGGCMCVEGGGCVCVEGRRVHVCGERVCVNCVHATCAGYVPEMKLYAEGPSHMEDLESVPLPPEPAPQWTEEISLAEAVSLIEKVMYPFKEASLLLSRR